MEQRLPPLVTGEPAHQPPMRRNTGRTIGIAAALLVVVAALAAAGYGLATHPTFTATLRDITIIILALATGLIGLSLVVLIVQLQSLIALLRDEVRPILNSANQTARTVRGTTEFLRDSVVKPVIAARGYASGVREAIRVLTGSRKRSPRRGSGRGGQPT